VLDSSPQVTSATLPVVALSEGKFCNMPQMPQRMAYVDRSLPNYPEPLTKEELKLIHENQTAILEWLKSLGHEIEDGYRETTPRRKS